MMKRGLLNLFLIVFFVFFIHSTVAQTGCFLYEGSPFYCQEITPVQADQECNFSDDCLLSRVFLENQRCEVQATCKKILCKSSCQQEFISRCIAGGVPLENEQEWCSPGCCQIPGNSCEFKENKWLCEISVLNSGKNTFQFTSMNQEQCRTYCQTPTLLIHEQVAKVSSPPVTFLPTINQSSLNESGTAQARRLKSSNFESSVLMVLLIFIAIFIIFILYVLLRKRDLNDKGKLSFTVRRESPLSRLFSPFSVNPEVQQHLRKIRQQHDHKSRENQREHPLATFGSYADLKPKSESEEFRRLKCLVRYYEKHQKPLTKEEKNLFTRLEELINPSQPPRLEGNEKKEMKAQKTTTEERRKIFTRLEQLGSQK